MNRTIIAIGASLVTGFALGAWILYVPAPELDSIPEPDTISYFDPSAAVDKRIRALEFAVGEERNARQVLEEELSIVLNELDRIKADSEQVEQERVANSRNASDARDSRDAFQRRRNERNSAEARTQTLIDAGLTPDRVAMILQRESELQMEAMQARFEARRTGEPFDFRDSSLNPDAKLRAEIGDTEYEMYLSAAGRSTSVGISGVLEFSPAQSAGLQPGDRITSYDGQRVFSTRELTAQTLRGAPGENVIIDIERDGIPMQVVMPRGPLGITGGRR